jgi:hypothetical protein
MKPYRILSVGWMTLCVFSGIIAFIQFRYLQWLFEGESAGRLFWTGCAIVIYALGLVASIFLDRGVMWSRIAVCVVAFFSAMVFGLAMLDGGLSRLWMAVFGFLVFYSWLSIIILLIPKRYVA